MVTLSTLDLHRLKNAEHVQFHSNVCKIIETAEPEAMGLSELIFSPYAANVGTEQDIVNKAMGSSYTIEMQKADEDRDLIFKRVRRKLELCELEPKESIAYLASPVVKKHLLAKYPNLVPSLPYQEETATITGFVQDCRELLTADQVKGICIDTDLNELESANSRFSAMYQERVTEKAAGDTQLSLKLRAATDETYQIISLWINALSNDPDPSHADQVAAARDAVAKINIVIRDAKMRLEQRLSGVVGEEVSAPSEAPDAEAVDKVAE